VPTLSETYLLNIQLAEHCGSTFCRIHGSISEHFFFHSYWLKQSDTKDLLEQVALNIFTYSLVISIL